MKKYRGLEYHHNPGVKPRLYYGDTLWVENPGYDEYVCSNGDMFRIHKGVVNVKIDRIKVIPETVQYFKNGYYKDVYIMKKYNEIKSSITDSALAKLAQVSRPTLNKWKRGEPVTERTERKIERTVYRLWGAIEGGDG